MNYADVIIDISHERLDHTFQYHIPPSLKGLVGVGSSVRVPFGKGNTPKKAYVVGFSDSPKIEPDRIKDIIELNEKDIPIESILISLAYWMKSHYGSTMSRALKTVIPIKKQEAPKEKQIIKLILSDEKANEILLALKENKRSSVPKIRLLTELIRLKSIPKEVITKKLNVALYTIKDMEKRDWIEIETIRDFRNPLANLKKNDTKQKLTPSQEAVYKSFLSDWEAQIPKTYLLYGVTGSGKTNVYMEMIERVLKDGKQVIVLIPEIALTFQTLMRFYNRFGKDVSVMHSKLSYGERYDQFERARNGDLRIMVGPRSALFTPFSDLGLIIIDEEHESTYKSEQMPKYHARETAIERARLSGASVVLGSATPSLESYTRAKQGKYKLLTLPERVNEKKMADCEIIDLRTELKEGNRSIISRRLKGLIEDRLSKNEQTILFINRRGLMSFISCRACGQVIKCPHCDVSLSLHRDGKMRCHYCGYEQAAIKTCPSCNSKYIGSFKVGTQKVEQVLKEMFSSARILRMDADTTKTKNSHEEILSTFANDGADILIGTQMIVKGHDFPGVTLVGILAADQSLNDHDFRSAERTFQLLTQAAGRAGRGDKPGIALIQTYRPEHFSIVNAAAQDYEAFYEKEISYRSLLDYPPVSHMLVIQLASKNIQSLSDVGKGIEEYIDSICNSNKSIRTSRLVDAGIGKINDVYRKMIYLKSKNEDDLIKIKDVIEKKQQESIETNVSVYFDFDPMQMM